MCALEWEGNGDCYLTKVIYGTSEINIPLDGYFLHTLQKVLQYIKNLGGIMYTE